LREGTISFNPWSSTWPGIKPGRIIRFMLNNTTHLWSGYVQSITYQHTPTGRLATLTAVDIYTWYSSGDYRIYASVESITASAPTGADYINMCLDGVRTPYNTIGVPASERLVEAGAVSIPAAFAFGSGVFGDLDNPHANPMGALRTVVQTEGGMAYVDRTGRLVIRNQASLTTKKGAAAVGALPYREIQIENPWSTIKNHVHLSYAGTQFGVLESYYVGTDEIEVGGVTKTGLKVGVYGSASVNTFTGADFTITSRYQGYRRTVTTQNAPAGTEILNWLPYWDDLIFIRQDQQGGFTPYIPKADYSYVASARRVPGFSGDSEYFYSETISSVLIENEITPDDVARNCTVRIDIPKTAPATPSDYETGQVMFYRDDYESSSDDLNSLEGILLEGFRIDGQGEYKENPLSVPVTDGVSQATYGRRTLAISRLLVIEPTVLTAYANALLADYKDPKFHANVQVTDQAAIAARDIWDKVSGIDGRSCVIRKCSYDWKPSTNLIATYGLTEL